MKSSTRPFARTLLLLLLLPLGAPGWQSNEVDTKLMREEVRDMFWHSYRAYMQHAFPMDELKPLACTGHDTWGSYALTLIDTLDTLVIMGDIPEFARAAQLVISHVSFDRDKNVSVFETNIRVVGGLLSAHLLAEEHLSSPNAHSEWIYRGELLRMAEDVARRLLPAFDTHSGIPFGTVNLRHGVPPGETPVTSLAGAGTHLLEFGVLSRLTGRPEYMSAARTAMRALWARRSALGLVGNHIDTR
jgi:mannosidase alpha-like ER degradation enhancer 2